MGLCGFSNAVVQVAVGGRIIRHFGPRRVFNAAFCALACVFSLYPLLSVLARRAGRVDGAVVAVLVCQLSGNFVLYYAFGGLFGHFSVIANVLKTLSSSGDDALCHGFGAEPSERRQRDGAFADGGDHIP